MIPAPLPPGDHSLTLSSAAETSKAIPVSVAQPPVKTVAAQGAASVPPTSVGPGPASSSPVAIRSVDASADGGMVARGSAEPLATVRLYISGAYVGDARTKDDGRWSLTIEHGITPGAYEVRADEIDPGSAKVVARAEAPAASRPSLRRRRRRLSPPLRRRPPRRRRPISCSTPFRPTTSSAATRSGASARSSTATDRATA